MDKIHQPIRFFIDKLRNRPVPDLSYKNTSCSSCHRFPISSSFFNCEECGDFDLCLDCYKSNNDHNHKMRRIGDDVGGSEEKKGFCIIC